MKILKMILALFSSFILFSQEKQQEILEQKLIIYANMNKNVSLFFDNPIKKGIVGNSHFKFGYNEEKPSNIGLLKASLGEESNLLVITENGTIYSFIIRYQKDIEVLNYFITKNMAVGNENETLTRSQYPKHVSEKSEKEQLHSNSKYKEAVNVNDYENNVPLSAEQTLR